MGTFVEAVKEIVEGVPVYQDAIQPGAKHIEMAHGISAAAAVGDALSGAITQ